MDIFKAVRNDDIEELKRFIDDGADVNARNESGDTALKKAAYYGKTEIVKLLLDRGANIHARNRNGYNALDEAIYCGHKDIIELLEQHKKN